MQDLKTILEKEFGVKVITQDNKVLKFHLLKLEGKEIIILNDLYISDSLNIDDLKIKRSGTGLTVLITVTM